jgi:ubiquinone/menaquinone biosynthesis C-methylase UbiE
MSYGGGVPGTSFDRVAGVYDETRGGERRGGRFADALAPWIVGPTVVELGVGTGLIAQGLQRHGLDVVGVDLSEPMMRHAVARIGRSVAVADVDELPLADDSVDTAFFVWVLQLVPDPLATLAEAARVVRPGGRVITILSNGEYDAADEIAPIMDGLTVLRPERLARRQVIAAEIRGLSLHHDGVTDWDEFPSTISQQIEGIENRIYSSMFDVDDTTWARVVSPVLEQLRALPDPDRPRLRRNRHPLVVWDVS